MNKYIYLIPTTNFNPLDVSSLLKFFRENTILCYSYESFFVIATNLSSVELNDIIRDIVMPNNKGFCIAEVELETLNLDGTNTISEFIDLETKYSNTEEVEDVMNRILDKINELGENSLNYFEKKFLEEYSQSY